VAEKWPKSGRKMLSSLLERHIRTKCKAIHFNEKKETCAKNMRTMREKLVKSARKVCEEWAKNVVQQFGTSCGVHGK
jgi:ERCC4-type nuclease